MPQHAAPSGLPAAILARLQQGAGGSALPLAPVPRGGALAPVPRSGAPAPAPGADSALIRGLLAVLPHDRGAPRAPAPRGGTRPSAPLAPIKWDFDVMGALIAVARFLQMFTTMTKYVPNPTYNLMFVNPNMVMPPVPLAPLPYREAKNSLDSYYHAFGDWGDYGYENQGNSGYGCAKGGCAPWWFSWTKQKGTYWPFVHRHSTS